MQNLYAFPEPIFVCILCTCEPASAGAGGMDGALCPTKGIKKINFLFQSSNFFALRLDKKCM